MPRVTGTVYLVGAGPGDVDLLTVKAVRLLQQADVVLHDALVSPEILRLIRPDAKVIDVGKRHRHKFLTQAEINSLLEFYAQRKQTIVRLKGGDPLIFGRAGEEIAALTEAGIKFEIVPGVTSALASATAAKVSLTDRRFASSIVFATARRQSGGEAVDWSRLVATKSTLAIYMPGDDYAHLSRELVDGGLMDHVPCTVVSRASLPGQQVLRTTLGALAHTEALPAPALLIVGPCANPAAQFTTANARDPLENEYFRNDPSDRYI